MDARLHLLGLQQPPPRHLTKPSPCLTIYTGMQSIAPLSFSSSSSYRRTNQLNTQAGSRGFGVAPTSNKKSRPEQENIYSEVVDNGSTGGGGGDDEDEIPQEVFDRIIRRVLTFVGAPMASGIALLYCLSFLKERGIWDDMPAWVPFLTVLLSFGTSALGIAYGTLSSSWDADREGSLLGWEEVQKNWPELWKEDENAKRR